MGCGHQHQTQLKAHNCAVNILQGNRPFEQCYVNVVSRRILDPENVKFSRVETINREDLN
jgi:hypothetical protein